VRLGRADRILPQIDTGMAHREPGVGRSAPVWSSRHAKCFDRAFEALVQARTAAAGSTARS